MLVVAGHLVNVPSQVATESNPFEQLWATQAMVFAAGVQAPEPLQPPATHVEVEAGQVLCGSWPVATGLHEPTEPARLHALQPLHIACAVSQQTPSTQLPVVHSPPPPHERAFGLVALH